MVRATPSEWGRMVESAVGAHLINHSITQNFTVHYWGDRSDEVDFIIERKGRVIALEVKTNTKVSTQGMSAFKAAFNPDKVLLIGKGGLPWEEFLEMKPVELF